MANAVTDPEIVPRSAWHARPAKQADPIISPVPYVVIHHTFNPPACNTTEECLSAMRWMQDFHQFNRTWWDIGYNFAVGGDGKVYEGRGWFTIGAHAPRYNSISMGISLIGDWTASLPPERQLAAAHKLIAMGVREGHIAEDYHLVGHRQVREGTECPGEVLYEEIKKWPHYDPHPDYVDLLKKKKGDGSKATPPDEHNRLQKGTAPFISKLL
ncbi:peptidoglycan-recognition protein LB isoform X2 [Anoplophora glabripennis]|uniref:Peptidoglycan-recognition protein n=1 Tax=Anoplophora glabripennis TaxID=217634 RepID=V5GVK1_ANOGL|nr:peptidoglycan-recognition protein LB isoform X2 [Anoplophora glabripennis]